MNKSEKKCFSLIQQLVTTRNPLCQMCGDVPVSAHHVFGRRNHRSSFNPDSCLSLCVNCHQIAHTTPQEAHDLLHTIIGGDKYAHLSFLSQQVTRLRDKDYLDISIELGQKLISMKSV